MDKWASTEPSLRAKRGNLTGLLRHPAKAGFLAMTTYRWRSLWLWRYAPCSMPSAILWTPIRREDIEFTWLFCISIGHENKLLPIRTEHGKGIESGVKGDSFQSGPIRIDQVETEFPTLWLMEV
jgi:hypothetical protein